MTKYFKKDFEEAIIKNLKVHGFCDGVFMCGEYVCEECWLNDSDDCYNDVQQLIKSVIRKEKLKKLLEK